MHLLQRVHPCPVKFRLQVVQLVGVRFVGEHCRSVVVGKRFPNGVRVVLKVENECVVFLWMRPVEPREGLHRLDVRQGLIDIHRVQQRLIVAGLELVGADQESVWLLLDAFGNVARGKAIEGRLSHFFTAILVLAGKCDDGTAGALSFAEVLADGVEVLDRAFDAAGHHHGAGLAADSVPDQHLVVEMVHHDLRLEADGVVVPFHEAPQLALCLLGVKLRVVLNRLGQPVVAGHRRVVGQNVHDEPLLDGLLHRVAVERTVLHGAVRLRAAIAEELQRLVLRGGGEREVAGVGEQPVGFHDPVDSVLVGLVLRHPARFGQRTSHRRRGLAALAGVGLVDDDREAAVPLPVPDLF